LEIGHKKRLSSMTSFEPIGEAQFQ